MDAYHCNLESYSSVNNVHGALEEPSGALAAHPGALVAHPGASEVLAGALEAHPNNNKADSGVCRHIYCYYEPP